MAGATRLWLFPEDLLKIGEVLLSQGFYQGQKIVSLDFIEFMKKKTSITKHHHNNNLHYQRYAYGSGLWLNSEDLYFGHGSDGQNLVIIPSQKAIILTLSNQSEVDSLEKIIDGIITSYF